MSSGGCSGRQAAPDHAARLPGIRSWSVEVGFQPTEGLPPYTRVQVLLVGQVITESQRTALYAHVGVSFRSADWVLHTAERGP